MLTVDPGRRITTQDIQRHGWFIGADQTAAAAAAAPAKLTQQVATKDDVWAGQDRVISLSAAGYLFECGGLSL